MATEIYDWPEGLAPVSSSFDLAEGNAVYSDPATGRSLRQRRSVPRWSAELAFQEMCPTTWKKLAALRARLKGQIALVRLFDFADQKPGGAVGFFRYTDGTGFTDGTFFSEESVVVVGPHAAGVTAIQLKTGVTDGTAFIDGDKIQILDGLYMLVSPPDTDADGKLTVTISPPLQEDVINLTPVKTFRPTALFYMMDGGDPIGRDTASFGSSTFRFVQDPYARS